MGCERLQAIVDKTNSLKVLINRQELVSSNYAIDYSIKIKEIGIPKLWNWAQNIKVTINTVVHIILEGKCPLILFCR